MSKDIFVNMRATLVESIKEKYYTFALCNYCATFGDGEQKLAKLYQDNFDECCAKATIPQLWALDRFLAKSGLVTNITFNGEIVGLNTAGMFVGIEPDGYTHS